MPDWRIGISGILAACAIVCFGASARGQPCAPYWTTPGQVLSGRSSPTVFDDGTGRALYCVNITLPPSGGIGRWDGHRWTLLGDLPAFNQLGNLLVLDDGSGPRLYASGVRTSPPALVYWLVRWNGQLWESAPPGLIATDGTLGPALSFDDGTGMAIYGVQCAPNTGCHSSWVVRWSGSSWVRLSTPPNNETEILKLGAFNLGGGWRLYAYGVFNAPGGGTFVGVTMWDRSAWQFLGSGVDGTPRAMCQYDDGSGPALYIGGSMTLAGGVPVHQIARWDGQAWSDVGGGITSTGITQVNGLAVFDDGRGPALYASGYFSQMGGVNANSIARWDGHHWEPLGNGFGVTGPDASFAAFDDGRGPSLFASGDFFGAGGGTTSGLAQWVGCPNCYANCDNSPQSPRLNVLDFICFLNKFAARDPYANCTVDATIDVNDFICFLNKFAAGCP